MDDDELDEDDEVDDDELDEDDEVDDVEPSFSCRTRVISANWFMTRFLICVANGNKTACKEGIWYNTFKQTSATLKPSGYVPPGLVCCAKSVTW